MDERVEKLNRAARIERLNQAALVGCINDIYDLIKVDVKLLEHIDELPFVETPLHKVASATETHIRFAKEMIRLKPSFVRKLNPDGLSPIHVALVHGKTQLVRWLLKVDGDLVRVKGRDGMTPLHDAAATATEDHLDLLVEFLKVCPDSIEEVTIRDETALHVAVKCRKLEAVKRLLEWLRENKSKKPMSWKRKILNWKNDEGNTVLHVAASTNQPEAVRLLLDSGVDIDAKNLEDHTAGDILVNRQEEEYSSSSSSREISEMLQRAEVTKCARYLRSIVLSLEERRLSKVDKWAKISDDRRNVLLVVATLLMAVTYQGLLSPPGGLWQDDYNPGSNLPNATIPEYRRFNETTFVENLAGTAIGARVYLFWLFLTTNTLTFILSYTMVLLVIPPGYVILRTALGSLSLCYIASMAVIFPIYFLYTHALMFMSLFLLFTLHVSADSFMEEELMGK